MQLVVCDDDITKELNKKAENNDFLLRHFEDEEDQKIKKFGLFKFKDCERLTDSRMKESLLGKKHKNSRLEELEIAVQLEHMRDYVYHLQSTEGNQTDFLVAMPLNEQSQLTEAKYFPIAQKIGMNKKTRQRVRVQTLDEEEENSQQVIQKDLNYIVIAPRVYTASEGESIKQTFRSISVSVC